jgi:hypothetical protein
VLMVPFSRRPIEHALHAGPALLQAARGAGAACFAASLVEGPAVLLGQHQRAARVLDLAEARRMAIPVFRRRTAGTAAFAGERALVFTLALPRITALFPDASFRTLLNRHVRPFLRGLTAAGTLAHYFGREWVSSRRRPVLLLGFDVEPDGAVLVEAIAGFDHSIALPPSLASGDERSLDRFTCHVPAALSELLPEGTAPETVARCIADAIAARAPTAATPAADLLSEPPAGSFTVDLSSDDPVPPGATLLAPARIPIGWLERAAMPGGSPLWLGGDVLAPRHVLDRISAAAASGMEHDLYASDLPLEGVNLLGLLEGARNGPGVTVIDR